MKKIYVYDVEAEAIEKIAEENGNVIEAEVIEAMFTALQDNDININDYM